MGSILGTTAVAAMVVSLSPEFAMLSDPGSADARPAAGAVERRAGGLCRIATVYRYAWHLYGAARGGVSAGGRHHGYQLQRNFEWIGNNYLGPVPWLVVIALAVIVVCWFILRRTTLGIDIYAVGGNMQAARLTGIKVWLVLLLFMA